MQNDEAVLKYTKAQIDEGNAEYVHFVEVYAKYFGEPPCLGCPNGFDASRQSLVLKLHQIKMIETMEESNQKRMFNIPGRIQIMSGPLEGRYIQANTTDEKCIELLAHDPGLIRSMKAPGDWEERVAEYKAKNGGGDAGGGNAEPTKKEIAARLDELGVEYPKKATKAELAALLEEAGD